MLGLSRRMFLKRGSVAVAVAGMASSIPLLSEAAGPAAQEVSPAAGSASAELPEGAQISQDLVAHVRDLSGQVDLYIGNRQVSVNDPALARALFQATR